ncbi:putative E3 ubiquitin-protein ligase herc4, partial [Tyrophagus putrescentiae]
MAKNNVYCFGNSFNGELPVKTEEDLVLVPQKIRLTHDRRKYSFVALASGKQHTLLLLKNVTLETTEVFSCGSNERHQLGRLGSWRKLEVIDSLSARNIVQISCGHFHSCALSEAGEVFSWGCNRYAQLGLGSSEPSELGKPTIIKKLATNVSPVIQVACGGNHNLALTKNGELWTFGDNSYGQCGIGSTERFVSSPTLVTSLQFTPIRTISAGGAHSAIVTFGNKLFMFGKNEFGQCSGQLTNSHKNYNLPTLQTSLSDHQIAYVSLGEEHSACITTQGGLFTFGAGGFGQCGHGKNTNEINPRQVFELMGSCIVQVSCGRCHTIVATETGKVLAFGLGASGQLGIGNTHSKAVPCVVSGKWVEINLKDLLPRSADRSLCAVDKKQPETNSDVSVEQSGNFEAFTQPIASNVPVIDSEMEIEELIEEEKDSEPNVESNFIIEEPDDSSSQSSNLLPSFLCKDDHTIFTNLDHIEIDEYETDPDSDSEEMEVLERKQNVLYFVVASKGDQSFVITQKYSETARAKDFRKCDNNLFEIAMLDNTIFEQFKNVPKDESIPLDIVAFIEDTMGSVRCWNASYISDSKNETGLDSNKIAKIAKYSAVFGEKFLNASTLNCGSINWQMAFHGFWLIEDAQNDRINELICSSILKILTGMPDLRHKESKGNVVQLNEEVLRHQVNNENSTVGQQAGTSKALFSTKLHNNLYLCLEVLKLLYFTSKVAKKISYKEFYIHGIIDMFDLRKDYLLWQRQYRTKNISGSKNNFLCSYPFIFDASAKSLILAIDSEIQQDQAAQNSVYQQILYSTPIDGTIYVNPYLTISVHRNTILQETINQLCYLTKHNESDFKKPLKVSFEGEDAVDAGQGMKKEFFLLLMKEILDEKYGMFVEYNETACIWFHHASFEEETMFHLIGVLAGLAIYNKVIINLPFPVVLYKKILGEPLDGLDDLAYLDPMLSKNLKEILNTSYGP